MVHFPSDLPEKSSCKVTFYPKNLSIDCMSGETLYHAALRQQVSFPVSCRNGNCLRCTGRLLRGICLDSYYDEKIYGNQSDRVELLLCKAVPKSDCDIDINGVLGPGELPLQMMTCRV